MNNAVENPYSGRLISFLTQMGPAVSSVTHLHINLPSAAIPNHSDSSATTALTAMLLPLASACSQLVQLTVFGTIGPALLQAFGSTCPHLTSLHASLASLPTSTLEQLPALLPHLTSLSGWPHDDTLGLPHGWYPSTSATLSTSACSIALKACPKLLSFDATSNNMTAELWAALPLGLTSCTTVGVGGRLSSVSSPPPMWQPHVGLHTLVLSAYILSLQELVLFLAAAPSLAILVVPKEVVTVQTTITDGLAAELSLVDARLGAGLSIVTNSHHGKSDPSTIRLSFELIDTLMSAFMTTSMRPLPNLTHLHFSCHGVGADLSQFPRVFSGLREVKFSNTTLDDGDLLSLASCSVLGSVDLAACSNVTCDGLAAMCVASSSMALLQCYECTGISPRDGRIMQRKGWGGAVRVCVDRGGMDLDNDHE